MSVEKIYLELLYQGFMSNNRAGCHEMFLHKLHAYVYYTYVIDNLTQINQIRKTTESDMLKSLHKGENRKMKFVFTTCISLLLILISIASRAQCPTEVELVVVDEQSHIANDGTIQVTFLGGTGNFNPENGDYNYHLWSSMLGGYVYNPSRLDPGFDENKDIALSFTPPNTITFKNLPPDDGYFVILTGKNCQRQYGSQSNGITIKAFKK